MPEIIVPKVSVVVPFYNSCSFVLNSINYLKKQTLKSFEVILVDDGSEDSQLNAIRANIEEDKRFKLISQNHLGAGAARNLGLSLVRGEYVIFLDSDDVYRKDLLEKLFLSASKWSSDVVLCDATFETNQSASILRPPYEDRQWAEVIELQTKLFQITSPVPWNKLIKTSLIHKYNLKFLPLQNSNDLTFTYSVMALAERISWVDSPLLQYGDSNPQGLQKLKDKNPSNIVIALEELLNNLRRYNKNAHLEESFFKMVAENILWNIRTFKNTDSRGKLLNNFITSDLYNSLISLGRKDINSGLTNFIKEFEVLKKTFCEKPFEEKGSIKELTNSRKHKFTVIIPFFNVERFIHIPIASLKRQTFEDFDVLLVNDGSQDNSKEFALQSIMGDSRFRVIDQSNQGQSSARNLGIRKSTSEYILFLDSDDALEPECLQKLSKYIDLYAPEVIFFEAKAINYYSASDKKAAKLCQGMNKYYARKGEYSGLLKGPEVMQEAVNYGEFIASPCLSVVKRSFLIENNIEFIPNIIHEDNAYTFELLLKSNNVLILKEKLYLRTLRAESTTTSAISIRNLWGYYSCFKKTQELMRATNSQLKLSEDQSYAFQSVSFGFLEAARELKKKVPQSDLFLSFLPKDERFIFERSLGNQLCDDRSIVPSKKELKLILLKRKIFSFLRRFYKRI